MATYQVRLISKKEGLDTTIEVDEETTILDAAEENGIDLPFLVTQVLALAVSVKLLKVKLTNQIKPSWMTNKCLRVLLYFA